MKLVGIANQQVRHYMYDDSGTIATGGTAQLVLGQSQARSFLKIQNLSNGPLWFEFGSARATCTIASGAVNAVTVTNAGFNFTKPPVVRFWGGGGGNTSYLGLGQPNAPAPSIPAQAHCVMTGAAPNLSVSSIMIDNPGSKYLCAPKVFLFNSDLDPNGVAVPSAGVGLMLPPQSPPFILNGTCCTTDPISVFGATTGQGFLCKWMD